LEEDLKRCYGAVGSGWVDYLVKNRKQASTELKRLKLHFMTKHAADANPQEIRIAKKFAAIYAVAKVAAKEKLVPWSYKEGGLAILHLFRRYLNRGRKAKALSVSCLAELVKLVGQKDVLPRVKTGVKFDKIIADGIAGLIREGDDDKLYLYTDRIKILEVRIGVRAGYILEQLREKGLIQKDSDGKWAHPTSSPWLDKSGQWPRPRMFVVSLKRLRSLTDLT
jgi:hypothetical protein